MSAKYQKNCVTYFVVCMQFRTLCIWLVWSLILFSFIHVAWSNILAQKPVHFNHSLVYIIHVEGIIFLLYLYIHSDFLTVLDLFFQSAFYLPLFGSCSSFQIHNKILKS